MSVMYCGISFVGSESLGKATSHLVMPVDGETPARIGMYSHAWCAPCHETHRLNVKAWSSLGADAHLIAGLDAGAVGGRARDRRQDHELVGVRVLRDQQPHALHLAVAVDPELCVVPAQAPFEQTAHSNVIS